MLAGRIESDDSRVALGRLIETYWYPIYAFSRRRGYSEHDAMDLTQGFFSHLMQQNALETVSPLKGKFRAFLLASFKNYLANEQRSAATQRRGGTVSTVSLSGFDLNARADIEPTDDQTAERLFEQNWVESLLDQVRSRLAGEYERAEKTELYRLLEPHLTNRGDAQPRKEIGRRLNLSPAALAMSLHRMRRRYAEILREEVAATLDSPEDINEELRSLMALLS